MAKIIFTKSGKTVELPDGTPIAESCEQVGIIFACSGGLCGACIVKISAGIENLSPPTDAEIDFLGVEGVKSERMACQTSILSGSASIDA